MATKFIQAQEANIVTGIGTSETQVVVANFKTISGDNITQAMIGGASDYVPVTLSPRTPREEQVLAKVASADGDNITLDIQRAVNPVTPYDVGGGIAQPHNVTDTVVISNNPALLDKLTAKDNNETVAGNWTFDGNNTHNGTETFTDTVDTTNASLEIAEATETNQPYTKGQTDTLLDDKADDDEVVKLTSNQTVEGVKTFVSSPVVPSASGATDAVNKGQMETYIAANSGNEKATDTIFGQVKLDVPADDPAEPVVIGANSPINEAGRSVDPADDKGRLVGLEEGGKFSQAFMNFSQKFLAGEDLGKNDAVYVSNEDSVTRDDDTITETQTTDDTDFLLDSNTTKSRRLAQIITVPPAPDLVPGLEHFETRILSVVGRGRRTAIGTGTNHQYGARITEVQDGEPGTPVLEVWTTSSSGAINNASNTNFLVTFSPSPVVVSGQQYAIEATNNAGGNTTASAVLRYQSAGGYPGGYALTTTNGGSDWTKLEDADTYFEVMYGYYYRRVDGHVYRTRANGSHAAEYENLIGVCIGEAFAGDEVVVQVLSVADGFDGLSVGEFYYLSNTHGEISTTPGSNEVRVGLALSSTSLLLMQ